MPRLWPELCLVDELRGLRRWFPCNRCPMPIWHPLWWWSPSGWPASECIWNGGFGFCLEQSTGHSEPRGELTCTTIQHQPNWVRHQIACSHIHWCLNLRRLWRVPFHQRNSLNWKNKIKDNSFHSIQILRLNLGTHTKWFGKLNWFRTSARRIPNNGASTVNTKALKPACSARCTSFFVSSRSL